MLELTVGSILGGSGICMEYFVRSTPTLMPSSTSVGDTRSPRPTTNLAICRTLMTYLASSWPASMICMCCDAAFSNDDSGEEVNQRQAAARFCQQTPALNSCAHSNTIIVCRTLRTYLASSWPASMICVCCGAALSNVGSEEKGNQRKRQRIFVSEQQLCNAALIGTLSSSAAR